MSATEQANAKAILSEWSKARRYRWMSRQIREGLAIQIRMMRLERGWTRGYLAARLRCGVRRIERLEDGRYLYSLRTYTRLANIFDVALIVHFVSWGEFLAFTPAGAVSFKDDAALHVEKGLQ